MDSSNTWRPLIAILANPETRRAAAELMLGGTVESVTAGLSPSRHRRVAEALVRSGLVDVDTQTIDPEVFRKVLDSTALPQKRGIDRFLDGTRIRRYPANLRERGQLLAWVASRVFTAHEMMTERELNDRLLSYSADVAVLRRYLVDYRLVERRSDGSEYMLTGSDPIAAID